MRQDAAKEADAPIGGSRALECVDGDGCSEETEGQIVGGVRAGGREGDGCEDGSCEEEVYSYWMGFGWVKVEAAA